MISDKEAELIDLTLRVFCLEKILINKKIFTTEEFNAEMVATSEQLVKQVLKAANYSGDIDSVIAEFKSKIKTMN